MSMAGFAEVHEETRIAPWTWPGTAEEVWEQQPATAAPFRSLLSRVKPDQWSTLNAEIHNSIRKYQNGGFVDSPLRSFLRPGESLEFFLSKA